MSKKRIGLLLTIFAVLCTVSLYVYHSFIHIVSYQSPYNGYEFEGGMRMSKGYWDSNKRYRVKDSLEHIVIPDKNSTMADIYQILWFEDSVHVYFYGPDIERYILYDFIRKRRVESDSLHFSRSISEGILLELR